MAPMQTAARSDFARRLLRALDACNLSRAQLSAALGVNKSLVSCWLSGEMKPTNYNLARISTEIARRKPGFNMTLWAAPHTEFESSIGLLAQTTGARSDSSRATEACADEAAPAHDKPSLAVLPFANLGQDRDYFVDGMMVEIVTALGRIRSIFVIGGGSSLSFKNDTVDPAAAARQLGVRYILEGSVRRSDARIRISVKLTDTIHGAPMWTEKFEDTPDDVFALQDRVALSIAGVIEPTVHAIEGRRAARRPVDSLGCYDLYLQAAALRATLQRAEIFKAIALLDRALALEPDFAPALGQAASCHSLVVLNNWTDDAALHRREGLRMAERAIAAGSDDAAVIAQTANALMELDHDVDRARRLIDRAVALNPGSAYARFVAGIVSLIEGDGEAASRNLLACARLDPLSPLGERARAHMAMARLVQGDFAGAARLHHETTYRTPRIHLMMAAVHGDLGNLDEASAELALYADATGVPPEEMVHRSIVDAGIRARLLRGLERAVKGVRRPMPTAMRAPP